MIDPLVVVFVVVIVVCVPLIGYLLPQDPTVARGLSHLSRWRRRRRSIQRQHIEPVKDIHQATPHLPATSPGTKE